MIRTQLTMLEIIVVLVLGFLFSQFIIELVVSHKIRFLFDSLLCLAGIGLIVIE